MDFDIDRKKINIFKIGKLYCFKYYFNDKQVFEELSKYYNKEKFRFECSTAGERNKIIKYLWTVGFDAMLVEDLNDYIVKIDRTKRYASILKDSIEQAEIGGERVFLMKDTTSVEQAFEQGAEQYTDKTRVPF
ncbi:MAG: hypothetical protein MUO73_09395 [Thermoplasmata archaeon]|nr:hypothetical protein [Thermoplasmata archaeon]